MRPVRVLVAGADSAAGVGFAAREAARRRCALELVSVLEPSRRRLTPRESVRATRRREQLLTELGELARGLLHAADPARTDRPPEVHRRRGATLAALVELAESAGLLVVTHEGRGLDGDSSSTTLLRQVVRHAACPVVGVPARWEPPARDAEHPRVVCGVVDASTSREVVAAAWSEATMRQDQPRLVHVYQVRLNRPRPMDEVYGLLPRAQTDTVGARADDEPSERLAMLLGHVVDEVVTPGAPGPVLCEVAADAELLVVGRSRAGRGDEGTVRSVLRHARTPVLVVDPAPATTGHLDLSGSR